MVNSNPAQFPGPNRRVERTEAGRFGHVQFVHGRPLAHAERWAAVRQARGKLRMRKC